MERKTRLLMLARILSVEKTYVATCFVVRVTLKSLTQMKGEEDADAAATQVVIMGLTRRARARTDADARAE